MINEINCRKDIIDKTILDEYGEDMKKKFKKTNCDNTFFNELTNLESSKKYLESLINNSSRNISSSKNSSNNILSSIKTSTVKRKRSEEMKVEEKKINIEEVGKKLQSTINKINSYTQLIENLKLKNAIVKDKLINSQILHDLNDYLLDVIYNDKNDVDKEVMKQDILKV